LRHYWLWGNQVVELGYDSDLDLVSFMMRRRQYLRMAIVVSHNLTFYTRLGQRLIHDDYQFYAVSVV